MTPTRTSPDEYDWRLPLLVIAPARSVAARWSIRLRLTAGRWAPACTMPTIRGCHQRAAVLVVTATQAYPSDMADMLACQPLPGVTVLDHADNEALAPWRHTIAEWERHNPDLTEDYPR